MTIDKERLRVLASDFRSHPLSQHIAEVEEAGEGISALLSENAALAAEVERLRGLAATCYAGLGAECDLPEVWLDALNSAANGEPFTTENLLPYAAMADKGGAP